MTPTNAQSRTPVWLPWMCLALWAGVVKAGFVSAWDAHVAAAVHRWASPDLDWWMAQVTFFGSSAWTLAVVIGSGIWYWRRHHSSTWLRATVALGIGMIGIAVLRLVVAQWRPDATGIPPAGDLLARFHAAGFPSGHAFRSAFLISWAVRERQRRAAIRPAWVVVGALLTWAIGISRISLNRHWPSDVVGAWLLAWATFVGWRWWHARACRRKAA